MRKILWIIDSCEEGLETFDTKKQAKEAISDLKANCDEWGPIEVEGPFKYIREDK